MSDFEDSSFESGDDDNFDAVHEVASTNSASTSLSSKPKATSPIPDSERGVEEIYQKMSQLEHILARPDTYIGSIEKATQEMWVYDKEKDGLVYKTITFVPGLYKIFDEILVNAADNKQRDPSMDSIKVEINQETGVISVYNNGKGIPVVIHKDYDIYVPTLIFGQLLTSSNYNDSEKKVTGGRNGYGAKLTNIYSTEFTVETVDMQQKKKFIQTWTNNMQDTKDPKITSPPVSIKADYTCIRFKPDLKRFNMDTLDNDIVSLMEKRVYDMAGTSDNTVKVYLNGKRLPVNNFQSYVKMYQSQLPEGCQLYYTKAGERWEIAIGQSDGHFQQVSFVNSICTTKGGQHVNYLADKVAAFLQQVIKKKNKKEEVKTHLIKNYLYICVNCLIENPAFDSQTKETLITRSKSFGSLPDIPESFLTKVSKSGIIDSILSFAKFKEEGALKRKGGVKTQKIKGIPKLDDANNAGTRYSKQCSLIITEGDSAKALAVSGLSIVGRDNYGVFPLRGKLLNVRDLSASAINKNEEIENLVKILGLKYGTEYTDTSSLRYGSLVIMADQDHDGSHIKGLVINFIHRFWPSLLKLNFLKQFITPIVKVTKGTKQEMFFTIPEYKNWLDENNLGKGWTIKYYKGLGTSTSKEGKEYFSNIERHVIPFGCIDDIDSNLIDMAFKKTRVSDRKEWINQYVQNTYVDYAVDEMAYKDFINKELILFSLEDNERSIPSVVDGFKPSQRKVLFGAFKRNLKSEIKVMQLAGYISEHAAYHHGEMSLTATIVNMAQDYVGSNNINLLVPAGQFGTRLLGGKDAASGRYIYTYLSKITRCIFKEEDDSLLNYLEDDGQSIEPDYYLPVIPFVLVNGSDGIGTGWSTSIPCYNPIAISQWIRHRLNGQPCDPLHPWWYGFTGEIIQKGSSGYLCRGHYTVKDENTIIIDELPIGRWTQDYKKMLGEYMEADKGKQPLINDFLENHTESRVHFTVKMTDEQMAVARQDFIKYFKLETPISTNNFILFDALYKLRKYSGPQEILEEFYNFRLPYFQKRKNFLINKLTDEFKKLSNKVRFILAVINKELVISNRKKKDIFKDLVEQQYDMYMPPKKQKVVGDDNNNNENETQEDIANDDEYSRGYDYLLSMKLWTLTLEKVEEIKKELENKKEELNILMATSPEQMWEKDLDIFEEGVKDIEKQRENDRKHEELARKKHEKNVETGVQRGASMRRARLETSFEGEEEEYIEKPKKKSRAKQAPKVAENVDYREIPSFFDPIPTPEYIPEKVPRVRKEKDTENTVSVGEDGSTETKPKRTRTKKDTSKIGSSQEIVDGDDTISINSKNSNNTIQKKGKRGSRSIKEDDSMIEIDSEEEDQLDVSMHLLSDSDGISDDDDDEEEEEEDFAIPPPKPKNSRGKKDEEEQSPIDIDVEKETEDSQPIDIQLDDDEEGETNDNSKGKNIIMDDNHDNNNDDDDDDDVISIPEEKPAIKRRAPATKKTIRKTPVLDEDNEDNNDEDKDIDIPKKKRTYTRKTKNVSVTNELPAESQESTLSNEDSNKNDKVSEETAALPAVSLPIKRKRGPYKKRQPKEGTEDNHGDIESTKEDSIPEKSTIEKATSKINGKTSSKTKSTAVSSIIPEVFSLEESDDDMPLSERLKLKMNINSSTLAAVSSGKSKETTTKTKSSGRKRSTKDLEEGQTTLDSMLSSKKPRKNTKKVNTLDIDDDLDE
ncbi:hypothetical protein WA158_002180 [Blastocystis sp. Blastoise]